MASYSVCRAIPHDGTCTPEPTDEQINQILHELGKLPRRLLPRKICKARLCRSRNNEERSRTRMKAILLTGNATEQSLIAESNNWKFFSTGNPNTVKSRLLCTDDTSETRTLGLKDVQTALTSACRHGAANDSMRVYDLDAFRHIAGTVFEQFEFTRNTIG